MIRSPRLGDSMSEHRIAAAQSHETASIDRRIGLNGLLASQHNRNVVWPARRRSPCPLPMLQGIRRASEGHSRVLTPESPRRSFVASDPCAPAALRAARGLAPSKSPRNTRSMKSTSCSSGATDRSTSPTSPVGVFFGVSMSLGVQHGRNRDCPQNACFWAMSA